MAMNAKVVAVVVAITAVLLVACAADNEGSFDLPAGAMRHKKHLRRGIVRHGALAASRRGGGGIPAVMTVNGFRRGESGGGPAACDGRFHGDGELIVALSSEWFAHGRRCHRAIRITSRGRTVEARVVDECDSRRGCKDNIVDSSPAVWKALGLNTNVGEVPVTWSDA